MPFEGQGIASTPKAKPTPAAPSAPKNNGQSLKTKPRVQISQPTGKLSTNNLGIRETLNPTKRKLDNAAKEINQDLAEDFTFEDLQRSWKEYALGVKRKKQESLFSTLTKSKMTMSSDYQIQLELANSLQAKKLEIEKVELLGFLRSNLKNYNIGLKCTVTESEKVEILDSKGIFDKLAEENSSLNKFRKLFNLDIEF